MTDASVLETLQQAAGTYLDQYVLDPRPVLPPGFSVHENRAWSVIPAIRKVQKTVGRGQNATTIEAEEKSLIAITSDHLAIPYDADHLTVYGLAPHAKPHIHDEPYKWPIANAARYIKNKETARPSADVFEELVDIWRTYVEYGDSIYYELMSLYIMQTYVFTIWPATGYLHFNGTLSSGKSRSLDVIESVGYNALQASKVKPSVLYRVLEGSPGTLCIDEQEMFKTDEQKELYSNLLGGYRARGKAILNAKTNDDWTPTTYSLYGPKAIASISQIDPTLASRSLIIPMVPALKQPAELPENSTYWDDLLHDLHVWALQNAVRLQRLTRGWNTTARFERAPKLLNRAWEVSRPYLVIADSFDQPLVERLVTFFNDYFVEQGQRMQETDKALMLLRALPCVLRTQHPIDGVYYSAKAIHETLLDFVDADQHDYYKTRHVHTHMTTLRFKDRKQIKGGIHYRLEEDQIRETFRHRSIQPFEEDTDWLLGKESYVDTSPAEQAQRAFDMESYL